MFLLKSHESPLSGLAVKVPSVSCGKVGSGFLSLVTAPAGGAFLVKSVGIHVFFETIFNNHPSFFGAAIEQGSNSQSVLSVRRSHGLSLPDFPCSR